MAYAIPKNAKHPELTIGISLNDLAAIIELIH